MFIHMPSYKQTENAKINCLTKHKQQNTDRRR